MQWRHRSVHIALRDISKKGVEIGERQNRCPNDICTVKRIFVMNFVDQSQTLSWNNLNLLQELVIAIAMMTYLGCCDTKQEKRHHSSAKFRLLWYVELFLFLSHGLNSIVCTISFWSGFLIVYILLALDWVLSPVTIEPINLLVVSREWWTKSITTYYGYICLIGLEHGAVFVLSSNWLDSLLTRRIHEARVDGLNTWFWWWK